MCVLWGCVHMRVVAYRGQKQALEFLESELQAVANHLPWMLGTAHLLF